MGIDRQPVAQHTDLPNAVWKPKSSSSTAPPEKPREKQKRAVSMAKNKQKSSKPKSNLKSSCAVSYPYPERASEENEELGQALMLSSSSKKAKHHVDDRGKEYTSFRQESNTHSLNPELEDSSHVPKGTGNLNDLKRSQRRRSVGLVESDKEVELPASKPGPAAATKSSGNGKAVEAKKKGAS